jgi:hypothetical protein
MDLDELIAREAIRDAVARYNATADTGRFVETIELFAEEAVLEIGDEVLAGRQAIREMFAATRDSIAGRSGGQPAYVRHLTATLQIDLVSATAGTARCYFQVLMAHGLDHWGRYIDRFALVDGRWRFTHRRVLIDGRTSGGWAADSAR